METQHEEQTVAALGWRRGRHNRNEDDEVVGLFRIRRGSRSDSSFDTIHRPKLRKASYPMGLALVVTTRREISSRWKRQTTMGQSDSADEPIMN